MSDAFGWFAMGLLFIAVPASQIYSLREWYRLVKLIDGVPLPNRRKIGWPDIRHTDPGILLAASGWSKRIIRYTYFRVMLRGLPQSHAIPNAAYSHAKSMRRWMLFALAVLLMFTICVMREYEFAIFIAFVLIFIRWLLGDWNEASIALKAASK